VAHALTLREAAEIHANAPLDSDQLMQVVPIIAAEYDLTCRDIEQRIACLARSAGRDARRKRLA
jgi:hypothetical protein